MVFTRIDAIDAFNHSLDNIFGQDDRSALKTTIFIVGIIKALMA
jgi:hypothetical protein